MTVDLSAKTQKLLEERLKSSEFESADDLLFAALEAFNGIPPVLDEETLDALDRAEDQVERGQVHDWADIREQFLAQRFKK